MNEDAMKTVFLARAVLLILVAVAIPGCRFSAPTASDYVVLLHGLGRTHRSMEKMESALGEAGYTVLNLDYPSRACTVPELAVRLSREIDERCSDRSRRIHFVTHSMGGIVVRCYLAGGPDRRIGRVVMLAPPNQGSELVDAFGELDLFAALYGPAGVSLGTSSNDLPRRLGAVDFELGVIAGDRSWNPLYSAIIPGDDDGKVSVTNARVAGMRDFKVVHAGHTFMMLRDDVILDVLSFLRKGRFTD